MNAATNSHKIQEIMDYLNKVESRAAYMYLNPTAKEEQAVIVAKGEREILEAAKTSGQRKLKQNGRNV